MITIFEGLKSSSSDLPQVTVTELVGWEHSMKNELIIASYTNQPRRKPAERLNQLIEELGLEDLRERFFVN